MKKISKALFLVALCSSLIIHHTEAARGGGRGGGGRAGGRAGGGAQLARTPSMGRAGGASTGHLSSQFPQAANRNVALNRSQVRGQAQQYMRQSNVRQPLNQQTFQQLQARNQPNVRNAQVAAARIRNNHPGYNNWFDNQFYRRHDYTPNFDLRNANWWAGASWYGMNDWVNGDWSNPVYYAYPEASETEPIIVNNYSVSQAAPPVATTSQAEQWMPIGIFAAAQDVELAPYSNMFVQLALNRDGDIAGAYYNSTTDELHPLDGSLDKQAQVVAWNVSDNADSPIMQTGLYNLSQDVTPVQVHFPDETNQVWYLVRIQEPATAPAQ